MEEFSNFAEDLAEIPEKEDNSTSEEPVEDLLTEWDCALLPSAPKMNIGERECRAISKLLMKQPRESETIKKIEEDYGFHKETNFLPPGLPIFMYSRLSKLPQRNSMEKQLKEIQTNLLQGLALVSKDLGQIKDNKQFLAGIYRLCNANSLINGARRENTLEAMNVTCGIKLYSPKHPLIEEEKVTLGEHSYISLFPNSLKTMLKDKYDPQMESLEALLSKSKKRSFSTVNKDNSSNGSYGGYVFKIQNFYKNWAEITSDPYILSIIKEGVQLGFITSPTAQTSPITYSLRDEDKIALDKLIVSLRERQIIEEVEQSSLKWCNPIFNVPRKNGLPRLIVDLSPLNSFLNIEHFKLEDISSAIDLVFKGCFFISIDLSDAYYSIGVKADETFFLGITSNNKFYKFNSLAFGIATAPKIFTRVTRPIVCFLRKQGWRICRYLDDFLIVAPDYKDAYKKSTYITNLLTKLGFLVNKEKSQLIPQKKILHLGFWLSNDGFLHVPEDKIGKLLSLTDDLLLTRRVKCRTVARYLGVCTACSRGIKNLSVYLRNLQQQVANTLKGTDNYNRFLTLSVESKEDLLYIKQNLRRNNGVNYLSTDASPDIIFTDASLEGWGAVSNGQYIKGTFSEEYFDEIIAIKEMLAIEYATSFFIKNRRVINDKTISCFTIKSDSLVCIHLLHRGGTTKGPRANIFNKIIKNILLNTEGYTVLFEHISGLLNQNADKLSREVITKEEITVAKEKRISLKALILNRLSLLDKKDLDNNEFNTDFDSKIDTLFNLHFIDLFASNANKLCCDFYSLYPQPNILREELERDLSLEVAETILASWSENTKKVYQSACSIWITFCKTQHRQLSNISINQLTDFVLFLKSQYSVSSVQTISAGITSLLHLSGRSLSDREKELLQRTLKGSTRLSLLSTSKIVHNTIWNLGEFLKTVKLFPDTEDLMFYAQKTITLLMIVSPQRVSELATLTLSNIQFFTSHTIFHITVPTKTKPQGFKFRIDNFPEDSSLCPIETLKKYITLSKDRRVDDSLFVTIKGPKKKVTTATLQRWIKLFLLKGNVDACAHSIRKSSTSWLFKKGITAEKIKNLCNWSTQGSTWERFYHKEISETNILTTLDQ
uniref:Reverse transcriptase domain-containing protein n=1 Tax=Strongyloides papillosus TaxID=174720 RepID=A0A0N5BR41_STREA